MNRAAGLLVFLLCVAGLPLRAQWVGVHAAPGISLPHGDLDKLTNLGINGLVHVNYWWERKLIQAGITSGVMSLGYADGTYASDFRIIPLYAGARYIYAWSEQGFRPYGGLDVGLHFYSGAREEGTDGNGQLVSVAENSLGFGGAAVVGAHFMLNTTLGFDLAARFHVSNMPSGLQMNTSLNFGFVQYVPTGGY